MASLVLLLPVLPTTLICLGVGWGGVGWGGIGAPGAFGRVRARVGAGHFRLRAASAPGCTAARGRPRAGLAAGGLRAGGAGAPGVRGAGGLGWSRGHGRQPGCGRGGADPWRLPFTMLTCGRRTLGGRPRARDLQLCCRTMAAVRTHPRRPLQPRARLQSSRARDGRRAAPSIPADNRRRNTTEITLASHAPPAQIG